VCWSRYTLSILSNQNTLRAVIRLLQQKYSRDLGSDSEKLGRVRRGARVFATGATVAATAARAVQQLGQLQQLQQRRLDAGFAEVTRKN
jgi:hypothetical protein